MSMQAENSRAVAGDNQANTAAARVTEYLERDYRSLTEEIDKLLAEARDLPTEVSTEHDATTIGLVIKKLREADGRAESYRETEKAPHRLSAEAVDSFFFRLRERLARRNPRDHKQKPGAADVLQARVNDFLERKRIEEEDRRRREAEETARIAREAQEKADRGAREAEEKRLAADRARKPENIAARTAEAEVAEKAAQDAAVEAQMASQSAQDARIATFAKPAELARTRGDGVLLTQARQPYAIVTDRGALDREKLWPFFTDAEIEKALRAWARTTGHSQPMPGAEIGFERKGVTR